MTAGSPLAASWLAATCRARSQLTGPLPGAASRCCSWRHELLHLRGIVGVWWLPTREREAERNIRHDVYGTRRRAPGQPLLALR